MIACKTKQWGNSVGIIIPTEVIKTLNIKPDEDILIDIEKKKSVLKELFGSMKFKKPTSQILKEARKELESKYI
jgi:antitoxin component of MazEF toxin-antitoxin module